MEGRKHIATIALSTALFFVCVWLAADSCGGMAMPDSHVDYSFWGNIVLPLLFALAVHTPLYDLISVATYLTGWEPAFNGATVRYLRADDAAGPWYKGLYYSFLILSAWVFAGLWTDMNYCG